MALIPNVERLHSEGISATAFRCGRAFIKVCHLHFHPLKFSLSGKKISSCEMVSAQFWIGMFHLAVICFIAQNTNLNKAFSLVNDPLVFVYFRTCL